MPLYKARAPSLPLPPIEYNQAQQDQFQNALRLYFNRLDNFLSELSGNQGGGLIGFPYISASDSTDQLATATNTPTVVKWNTLEGGNGFTLNAPGSATALVSGIYKITYSLQFVNTDNSAHDAAVWLKVNTGSGYVDIPNSTTVFSVPARKSAGVFSFICAYSEVVFTLNAGDDMELYWATNQAYSVSPAADGVYMEHLAAQTSPYARPATPSALGSITFVSAIPT
jgi:hypothetical protein